MAFSDTGENTQPRNGLKRNSLVLATHSALCKRPPPSYQVLGGRSAFLRKCVWSLGGETSHPHWCLAPRRRKRSISLGQVPRSGIAASKGRHGAGWGGARRAAAGLCAWVQTRLLAQPHHRRAPAVQPPPPRPPAPVPICLLPRPRLSPRRVPPRPCLAHAVISSLSPWSPGAAGLSDAVWPLEPVCEVQISSTQTLCDRGQLLNFSVPWSPCRKTQPLPVVGEDEMCKPKRSPLNSDT